MNFKDLGLAPSGPTCPVPTALCYVLSFLIACMPRASFVPQLLPVCDLSIWYCRLVSALAMHEIVCFANSTALVRRQAASIIR